MTFMKPDVYLEQLYRNRFSDQQRASKTVLWQVLVRHFLQKYVKADADVLDIGGGYGEFINHIQARSKYLIDLNPDAKKCAAPEVKVWNLNILDPASQRELCMTFDIIFISNFFEHLSSKEDLLHVLIFCFTHLKAGGALLVIQPNFKYAFREYYDFIDHHLPLTHLSLQELLQTVGFKIDLLIPRFLPYSTKGCPASPKLLRLYLKLPLVWRFVGGQMFIKASRPLSLPSIEPQYHE